MRGHVEVWGDSAVHSMGGFRGRAEGRTHTHTEEHTHTHTGTYTRMLHLPFSDLPFKSVGGLLREWAEDQEVLSVVLWGLFLSGERGHAKQCPPPSTALGPICLFTLVFGGF